MNEKTVADQIREWVKWKACVDAPIPTGPNLQILIETHGWDIANVLDDWASQEKGKQKYDSLDQWKRDEIMHRLRFNE